MSNKRIVKLHSSLTTIKSKMKLSQQLKYKKAIQRLQHQKEKRRIQLLLNNSNHHNKVVKLRSKENIIHVYSWVNLETTNLHKMY